MVRSALKEGATLEAAARGHVSRCLAKTPADPGTDNMTVLLVALNP